MNKKIGSMLLFSVIFAAMLAASALAAVQQEGMLGSIFGMFGNLNELYDNPDKNYSTLIDLGVYLVIFIGLAQATIGKKFENKGGKVMVAGIGIVLAVGLALWEKTAGFNLKSFGPVAMIILLAIMCFACYQGLQSFNFKKTHAFIMAYILFYTALIGIGLMGSISSKFPMVASILGLVFLVSAVVAVIAGVQFFRKNAKDITPTGDLATDAQKVAANPDAAKNLPDKEKENMTQEEKKEEKLDDKVEKTEKRFEYQDILVENDIKEVYSKIEGFVSMLNSTPKNNRAEKKKYIQEARKKFEELKGSIGHLFRHEKKENRYAFRAHNQVKALEEHMKKLGKGEKEKILEKLDEQEVSYALSAEKLVQFMKDSLHTLEGTMNAFEENLKKQEGLIATGGSLIQKDIQADFSPILKALSDEKNAIFQLKKYLDAIIVITKRVMDLAESDKNEAKKAEADLKK